MHPFFIWLLTTAGIGTLGYFGLRSYIHEERDLRLTVGIGAPLMALIVAWATYMPAPLPPAPATPPPTSVESAITPTPMDLAEWVLAFDEGYLGASAAIDTAKSRGTTEEQRAELQKLVDNLQTLLDQSNLNPIQKQLYEAKLVVLRGKLLPPTATPVPTNTPIPTRTPVATATPTPTPISTPTATPIATPALGSITHITVEQLTFLQQLFNSVQIIVCTPENCPQTCPPDKACVIVDPPSS